MFKRNLFYTQLLVCISITASLLSLYTSEKSWGELYPFYHYKLFSQPTGSKHSFTEYRIYAKNNPYDDFRRIPVSATNTFVEEQYITSLDYFVTKTIEDSLQVTNYKSRLLALVKHLEPGQAEYKIVSESYDPIELLDKNIPYDTATVISF